MDLERYAKKYNELNRQGMVNILAAINKERQLQYDKAIFFYFDAKNLFEHARKLSIKAKNKKDEDKASNNISTCEKKIEELSQLSAIDENSQQNS